MLPGRLLSRRAIAIPRRQDNQHMIYNSSGALETKCDANLVTVESQLCMTVIQGNVITRPC